MALPLVLMLAACGRATGGGDHADGGAADAADAAPAVDAIVSDAGPWRPRAALLTRSRWMRPALVCGDFAPCPIAYAPPLVLRARSVSAGVELRGGSVEGVTDGGVASGYADRLTPVSVVAEVGAPYEDAAGLPRRPFATVAAVVLSLTPQYGQPPLPIRNAVISGSIDAADVPTSNDPELGGKVEGCFTRDDAEQIYLQVLTMTLRQLLEGNGNVLDADCTGGGTLDGYAFEAMFEGEVVELLE